MQLTLESFNVSTCDDHVRAVEEIMKLCKSRLKVTGDPARLMAYEYLITRCKSFLELQHDRHEDKVRVEILLLGLGYIDRFPLNLLEEGQD